MAAVSLSAEASTAGDGEGFLKEAAAGVAKESGKGKGKARFVRGPPPPKGFAPPVKGKGKGPGVRREVMRGDDEKWADFRERYFEEHGNYGNLPIMVREKGETWSGFTARWEKQHGNADGEAWEAFSAMLDPAKKFPTYQIPEDADKIPEVQWDHTSVPKYYPDSWGAYQSTWGWSRQRLSDEESAQREKQKKAWDEYRTRREAKHGVDTKGGETWEEFLQRRYGSVPNAESRSAVTDVKYKELAEIQAKWAHDKRKGAPYTDGVEWDSGVVEQDRAVEE